MIAVVGTENVGGRARLEVEAPDSVRVGAPGKVGFVGFDANRRGRGRRVRWRRRRGTRCACARRGFRGRQAPAMRTGSSRAPSARVMFHGSNASSRLIGWPSAILVSSVAQIRFGVNAVELCRLDDGVDRGGPVAAGIGPGEEKILLPGQYSACRFRRCCCPPPAARR